MKVLACRKLEKGPDLPTMQHIKNAVVCCHSRVCLALWSRNVDYDQTSEETDGCYTKMLGMRLDKSHIKCWNIWWSTKGNIKGATKDASSRTLYQIWWLSCQQICTLAAKRAKKNKSGGGRRHTARGLNDEDDTRNEDHYGKLRWMEELCECSETFRRTI